MFREFVRANAEVLERLLRHWADKIHQLIPGSPVLGNLLFFHEGKVVMASIEVTTESTELNASVSFLDAEGNPTTADDVPAWSSDNEAAATVAASEDGLSAVVSIGSPGAAIISVTSTNTDGTTASAQGTITVLAGDASVGEVVFEEPVA
jgi:hypothetical protein